MTSAPDAPGLTLQDLASEVRDAEAAWKGAFDHGSTGQAELMEYIAAVKVLTEAVLDIEKPVLRGLTAEDKMAYGPTVTFHRILNEDMLNSRPNELAEMLEEIVVDLRAQVNDTIRKAAEYEARMLPTLLLRWEQPVVRVQP